MAFSFLFKFPQCELSFEFSAEPDAFFFTNHVYFIFQNLRVHDSIVTVPLHSGVCVKLVAEIFGDTKVGRSVAGWMALSNCGTLLVLFNKLIYLYVSL